MNKIKYAIGDLLAGPQTFILQGCNAQGKMNSGVAKAIRNKYPEVYDEYVARHKTKPLKLGEVVVVKSKTDERIIFNAITQFRYGYDDARYVNYGAIEECMYYVNLVMARNGPYREVAMPMIGAGLGGGDWSLIANIIERNAIYFQPVVYDIT